MSLPRCCFLALTLVLWALVGPIVFAGIVVTGLNRDKKDYQRSDAGVCAVDIKTGKVLRRLPRTATTGWSP
ncbi:MAG: hypothetical protein HYX68_08405 [Planctomycetes bacterium]|nr:hypothetical protein [Planctomycetota bacterium]